MTILHTGIKAPAALHPSVVAWYEAALAPLGYTKALSFLDDQVVGFADAAGEIDWYVSSAAAAPPGVPAPAEGDADVGKILGTHTAFGVKGSYLFHVVSLILSLLSRRSGRGCHHRLRRAGLMFFGRSDGFLTAGGEGEC
jgi:hypothetical protein